MGGGPKPAPSASSADVESWTSWAIMSSRRRSVRSASVPPMSDIAMSGTSSARPIRPTSNDEWVSTYT